MVSNIVLAGSKMMIASFTDLCNGIIKTRKILDALDKKQMLSIDKGDPMSCDSYRGVKLLEHGLKIFERIVE